MRLLFRPDACLGVIVLLSFLSLTGLLLWSAPNTPTPARDEAYWIRPLRPVDQGLGAAGVPSGSVQDAQSSVAATLFAMEGRLAAMDQRLQTMGSGHASYDSLSYDKSSMASVSQGQLDGLVQSMTDAFSRVGQKASQPAQQSYYDSYFDSPRTTTPEWQGQLKELRETVERLSHQSDDRFLSLMQPQLKGAGSAPGAEQLEGHVCRSPPCSRDVESCKANNNCCADLMFEMLVDFSDFLKRQNVTFMLSEGTLLGAVREKDIIPYTADLDLFIPHEGWDRVKLINEEPWGRKGYHFMVDPDQPHCARLCAVWEGMPANRAPFDQHFPWDTEKLGNDLAYYMDIYDEEMDFAEATKHLIYPPSNVTIRNKTFPAPREQEIYVEARYGPSWRTPDHQAREIQEKYPTLEQARVWSTNTLMLKDAMKDAPTGYRLLERAKVDYKTGHIVIAGDQSQLPPRSLAKELRLEHFKEGPNRTVIGGDLSIVPPDQDEGEIVDYVLYWAKEDISSYSEDTYYKRIDSGVVTGADDDNRNPWQELIRAIGRIPRCKGAIDPFEACSQRGVVLDVQVPRNLTIPPGATHLAVTVENEAGESRDLTAVELNPLAQSAEAKFSHRVHMGLFAGGYMDIPESCSRGSHLLRKEGVDEIIEKMVLKTQSGMRAALDLLAAWLRPVVQNLEECPSSDVDGQAYKTLEASIAKLSAGKLVYEPGKVLTIGDVSIFMDINSGIGSFRKGHFLDFGRRVGNLLRSLADASAPSEDSPFQEPSAQTAMAVQPLEAAATDEDNDEDEPPGSSSLRPVGLRGLLAAKKRSEAKMPED